MADKIIIGYDNIVKLEKKFRDKSKRELLNDIGFGLVNVFKKRMARGEFAEISPLTKRNRVGGGDGGKPLNDTGNLRNSLTHRVLSSESVAVGSPVTYAALMQEGGTIEPKTAKKLAIPVGRKMSAMSKAKGVRGTLEKLSETTNIWFTENAIMGQTRGSKRAKPRVLFIRKDKVVIPPRPYLYLDEKDELYIAKKVEAWYKEVL